MKNILIINSSFRKKNTYSVLEKLSKKFLELGFNTEIINLKDYNIKNCTGCEMCILKDKCFIQDDMELILNKIKESDGVVISTPVYLNNMSGMLKTFIDRTCKWFHRPEITTKPVLLVASTAGSGLKNTFKSIEESLVQWGVDITGTIGRSLKNLNDDISQNEISGFVNHIKTNRKSYKTTFKQIITFNVEKVVAIKILPLDKEYWINKGWDKKGYYNEEGVSKIKMWCGNQFYNMLSKKIKPINNTDQRS